MRLPGALLLLHSSIVVVCVGVGYFFPSWCCTRRLLLDCSRQNNDAKDGGMVNGDEHGCEEWQSNDTGRTNINLS